jgi:enoyl-CoA hydratase/carnithine racemase
VTEKSFLYEKRGAVAHLTVNRPAKRNAMNQEVYEGLRLAAEDLDADPSIRCAILSGAEGNFGAGKDMTWQVTSKVYQPTYDALQALKKPLIAAIDGHCIGASLHIALFHCDIRIATDRARLAEPAKRTDAVLSPDAMALPFASYMGLGDSLYFILTGKTLTAADALAMRLVNEVVPPEQLMERAEALAARVCLFEPQVAQAWKELLRRQQDDQRLKASEMQSLVFRAYGGNG